MDPNKRPLYLPLSTANSIRLIRFHRREDSAIAGALKKVCLDAKDCPSYVALSYT